MAGIADDENEDLYVDTLVNSDDSDVLPFQQTSKVIVLTTSCDEDGY